MSVKAYKVFRVRDNEEEHPKLRSVYYDANWPKSDGTLEAECYMKKSMWWGVRIPDPENEPANVHEEISPHDGCAEERTTVYGCGIYSVIDLEQAREWRRQSSATSWSVTVLAEVKVWGKTVPHELGYRSQFCKITGIIPLGDEPTDVEQTIAHEYDVPLLEKEEEDG